MCTDKDSFVSRNISNSLVRFMDMDFILITHGNIFSIVIQQLIRKDRIINKQLDMLFLLDLLEIISTFVTEDML